MKIQDITLAVTQKLVFHHGISAEHEHILPAYLAVVKTLPTSEIMALLSDLAPSEADLVKPLGAGKFPIELLEKHPKSIRDLMVYSLYSFVVQDIDIPDGGDIPVKCPHCSGDAIYPKSVIEHEHQLCCDGCGARGPARPTLEDAWKSFPVKD